MSGVSNNAAGSAAVLLVLDALPLPLTEGDRMRSYYLARALAQRGPCVLAAPASNPQYLEELRQNGPFSDFLLLPQRPARASPRRLLRTDNGQYLRAGWPDWWTHCQRLLQDCVAEHAITTVIAGKLPVAELVAALDVPHRVLDDFDCYTLTLEREYALNRPQRSLRQRIGHRLAQSRYRRQESHLSQYFQLVTTISPADGARLQALDLAARVEVVPNGVNPDLLLSGGDTVDERGVAFWGNLAFEPNRSAVQWFIEQVYAPWLAESAVPCLIIGRGADSWIDALPQRYPAVQVLGFVEDLPQAVRRVPVMINPMVSGSGLKNKMLEAMAMARAVVSTSMGSEALAVRAGEHFLLADEPSAFADAILDLHKAPGKAHTLGTRARELVAAQYTWPCVEARWRDVFDSLGAAPR